jgi:hypothetical protein
MQVEGAPPHEGTHAVAIAKLAPDNSVSVPRDLGCRRRGPSHPLDESVQIKIRREVDHTQEAGATSSGHLIEDSVCCRLIEREDGAKGAPHYLILM